MSPMTAKSETIVPPTINLRMNCAICKPRRLHLAGSIVSSRRPEAFRPRQESIAWQKVQNTLPRDAGEYGSSQPQLDEPELRWTVRIGAQRNPTTGLGREAEQVQFKFWRSGYA